MFYKKVSKVPIVLLVSAFITLDFTLLFLNVSITKKLENDARLINVTGRQRMLSQNIAKNLLLLNAPSISDQEESEEKEAIKAAAGTFNQTLMTLKNGGTLSTPDGKTVIVEAIDDLRSQQLLSEAFKLWNPVFRTLNISRPHWNNPDLLHYALHENEAVLFLMNELTVRSEHLSIQKSQMLRIAQVAIFALVLLNFILIIYRLHLVSKNNRAFKERLEGLLKNLPQAVLLVDNKNHISYTNTVAEQLFDQPIEILAGKPITYCIEPPLKNRQIQIKEQYFELSVSHVMTVSHEMKLVSLMNITESIQLKQKSSYDVLTSLLNRNGLIEAYEKLAIRADEICCLFLDLDKFKAINDNYGHPIGDKVLTIVAQRLKSSVKSRDIIARFGGDEFVIMFEKPVNVRDVDILCNRLENVTSEDIHIGTNSYNVGISIGVRIGNPRTETFEQIINDADKAMYENKKSRKLMDHLIQGKAIRT